MRGGEVRDGEVFVGTPQNQESGQTCDCNDVIEHRRPHIGAENSTGIEELTEQVIEPVEEDLRQTQEGEGNCKGANLHTVARRHDDDEKWRKKGRNESHHEEDRSGQCDEAVDVNLAFISLECANNLRNQDSVENAGGKEIEDRVGQGVCCLECSRDRTAGRTQRRQ